jgi:ribosome maturation factor RimP
VNVRTASPVDDARVHTGVLRSVADDEIVVDVDGAERSIPRVTITSARTVADWAAELKGSV